MKLFMAIIDYIFSSFVPKAMIRLFKFFVSLAGLIIKRLAFYLASLAGNFISDAIAYTFVAAVTFLNGLLIFPSVYYTQRKFDRWDPKVDDALKEEVATHIEYGTMVVFIYDIFERDKNSVNHSKCYLGELSNVNEAFKILYPGFEVQTLLKTNPQGFISEDDFTFFGLTAFNESTGELVVVYRGTVTESEEVEDTRALGAEWRNVPHTTGKKEGRISVWQRFLWGFVFGADSVVFHRGFKSVYTRAIRNRELGGASDSPQIRLRGVIDKLGSQIKKITITGHSLGAATSVVCGLDLAQYVERKKLPAKVELVTFACPMTGDDKLGDEFKRLGVRHVHYLNRGDIVPSGMVGRYKHDSVQETRRLVPAWNDEKRVINKRFFHFLSVALVYKNGILLLLLLMVYFFGKRCFQEALSSTNFSPTDSKMCSV